MSINSSFMKSLIIKRRIAAIIPIVSVSEQAFFCLRYFALEAHQVSHCKQQNNIQSRHMVIFGAIRLFQKEGKSIFHISMTDIDTSAKKIFGSGRFHTSPELLVVLALENSHDLPSESQETPAGKTKS